MSSNLHKPSPRVTLTLCTAVAALLSVASAHADQSNDAGHKLVDQVCTSCHGLAPIEATRNGAAGWRGTVFDMVDKGAQVQSQAQLDTIVNYLSVA